MSQITTIQPSGHGTGRINCNVGKKIGLELLGVGMENRPLKIKWALAYHLAGCDVVLQRDACELLLYGQCVNEIRVREYQSLI